MVGSLPKKLKDQIHNVQNRRSGEISNIFFEIYKNSMMPYRCHIYQNHLTCLWQKCINIHIPNINFHTGNSCCIVVYNFHVLISQFRNQISITQKHVLQYVFQFIIWSHTARFMSGVQQTEKNIFIVTSPVHNTKFHTRKYLVVMETYISDFHISFYIPEIQKMASHLPHVCILGDIQFDNTCHEAFKRRAYF